MFFVLLILKSFFINSTKYVFFLEQKLFSRIQFLNAIPKCNFFFLKTQKTILKNCFSEQFSKTATKQALRVFISYFVFPLKINKNR